MPLPRDMAELERLCWSLAPDRMTSQPLAALLLHAEPPAAEVLRELGDLRKTPSAFFGAPGHEGLRERLPPPRWAALARAFVAWARSAPPERPAPSGWIRAIDGLPEPPPREPKELDRWLRKHGVRRRLQDSIRLAAPLASSFRVRQEVLFAGPRATVEDALQGRLSPRYRAELAETARSYLSWAAGRLRTRRGREELWERSPSSEAMRAAARRVRALIEELDREGVPVVPISAQGVRLDLTEDGYAYRMVFPNPQGYPGERQVLVHLVEQRNGRALHSLDDPRALRAPEHLRVAAEWALDLLVNEEDELHVIAREALERPRWTHLLAQLESEVATEPEPVPFQDDERLVWRVGEVDGSLSLEPAVQKKRRTGWTKGRRVDPSELVSRPAPLDRRDERVLAPWHGGGTWKRFDPPLGLMLEALVGHPRVVFADQPTVPLNVRRGALDVRGVERRGETWITFGIEERVLEPHELLAQRLEPSHLGLLDRDAAELLVVPVPASVLALARAWSKWQTGLPSTADDALLAILGRLPPSVGLELPPRLRGRRRLPDLKPVLRLEPLPGGGLRVTVAMRPLGTGPVHPPGEGPRHLVGVQDGERVHVVRDLAAERRAADEAVARLALDAGVPDGPRAFRLDDPEDALDFLAALRARPEEVIAEWPEDLAPWRVVGGAGLTNLKVQSRKLTEWFELDGEATFDEGKVTLAQIMAALREGRRYVALGKGRFARIEDDLRRQLEPAQDFVFPDGASLGVSGAVLAQVEELFPEEMLDPDREWRDVRARLASARELDPDLPAGLHVELRGYQREGVRWLQRVSSWATGACLADDMGLGKTVQALALVLDRADRGPSLVVGPTSLADNWRKECQRFAPTLRPVMYRGTDREAQLQAASAGDLFVTSYDVMLRDAEALESIAWSTVIFDEAHALKNARTQRAKAARRLTAGFRLGLTGTPLENHIGELFSLFSILVPGLLGPWSHFRERFALPIEREDDLSRRERLRSLLRPFLLRRTKEQVAPELPPRTDVVRTVELSEDERALYEAERRETLAQLRSSARDPKKRFAVLAALTRLRRLACHPALVHPESRVPSSKLADTLDLVEDLRAEGHRALVFSQFTSHLELVRRALRERGIETLYLDGSTPAAQRNELVDLWQKGRHDLFLISLKAGGTGLNLTAADTVIHLDPWWNPAAEDQASDRTHRIGQDKPVTVVRLVSQGTIEERVVALHEEKRELARGILEGAETNAKLSTDELLALLDGG